MQYSKAEFERRCERVRVLLSTHDHVYEAAIPTEKATPSGFGESVQRTYRCGSCGGIGCGQCERSKARAAELGVELKPGRVLVEERDPYDTGRDDGFDPDARTKRQRADEIDRTITRLQEQELVRQGVYAEHVDHEEILEAAAKRDARGSYREVRAALDAMPRDLHGETAVRWIARWIPGSIRIPRWAYEQELERLEEQVSSLYVLGFKVSEIAAELSISQRQVRNAIRAGAR